MHIVPAILTDSFNTLQQQLDLVRYISAIEAVQIDVIDGHFVDNLTVTPLDLTVADFDPLHIDFHFMTEEPMDFVYECEGVKDYLPIRRIYGQVERMSHQQDFLREVRSNNWEAGLAVNLFTPLEAINEETWSELDHILLMAVEAGEQNQTFHKQVLEKVKQLREQLPSERLHITVDGGIKLSNAAALIEAGVNELNVGSAIWKSVDPAGTIEEFYQS